MKLAVTGKAVAVLRRGVSRMHANATVVCVVIEAGPQGDEIEVSGWRLTEHAIADVLRTAVDFLATPPAAPVGKESAS